MSSSSRTANQRWLEHIWGGASYSLVSNVLQPLYWQDVPFVLRILLRADWQDGYRNFNRSVKENWWEQSQDEERIMMSSQPEKVRLVVTEKNTTHFTAMFPALSGPVSKTKRYAVVFSSWWRNCKIVAHPQWQEQLQ